MNIQKGRNTFIRGIVFIFPLMAGCTTITIDEETGRKTEIGIGFVKIKSNIDETGIIQEKRNQFGFWNDGTRHGIGLHQLEQIKVPLDCQVTFIIKSKSEAEQAVEIIENLVEKHEGKICLLDSK